MNSRWRSLFFSFTNAPATGFPDASCTTPSTAELFSAARANWPQRNSKTAAKMTVNFDRVPLDVIPDLLVFLAPRVSGEPVTNAVPNHRGKKRRSKCVLGPDYARSIRQFRFPSLTIFKRPVKGCDAFALKAPQRPLGGQFERGSPRKPGLHMISNLKFQI